MRLKPNSRALLAVSLVLLLLISGPFPPESVAQDEGAPANGVRLENLSGVDIEFTLKNRETDWLSMRTLAAGAREPFLYRDEIKFRQKDGSFTYHNIPLAHVYRIYMKNGWLEIQQVPKR